jgi:hypothetical protein
MQPLRAVVYRAGTCALCECLLESGETVRRVQMHVFGPSGIVVLQCRLCEGCIPTPVNASATSGVLATRILSWYRSNPDLWPTLHVSVNG